MTLGEVIIDFTGGSVARAVTFTAGQAYVALSRVRSLSNLKLERKLQISDIKFDKKATDFTMKVSMLAMQRRQSDIEDHQLCEHLEAA